MKILKDKNIQEIKLVKYQTFKLVFIKYLTSDKWYCINWLTINQKTATLDFTDHNLFSFKKDGIKQRYEFQPYTPLKVSVNLQTRIVNTTIFKMWEKIEKSE